MSAAPRFRRWMERGAAAMVLLAGACAPAGAQTPPAVSWDWYHAAEILRLDPRSSRHDLAVAASYHRRAAEGGNLSSAYKLAEMYEAGAGVAKSPERALAWYRMAAERGDIHAQVKVGHFCEKGIATPRDAAAARRWYERAAAGGNPWAFHMLGFLYADGVGVTRDEARAIGYFERSLPHTGDAWAKWRLATLIRTSEPGRARLLLGEAAAAGIAQAEADLTSSRAAAR